MSYEDYKLIKKLGRGAFGIIYLAKNRETKEYVGLKIYNENVEWGYIEDSAELSMTLDHPNLMKCYTFFHDRIFTNKNQFSGKSSVHIFTVLEYIKGVTLSEVDITDAYISQIVSGLNYLHTRKLIHRDIKPENILLLDGEIKIIDYDFLIKNNNKIISKVGTPYFIAPEIFLRRKYDEKIDNWALGITIYFCLKGVYPFLGKDEKDLKKNILSDFSPDYSNISDNYQQIIKGLLTKDPNFRMSLNEVLTRLN